MDRIGSGASVALFHKACKQLSVAPSTTQIYNERYHQFKCKLNLLNLTKFYSFEGPSCFLLFSCLLRCYGYRLVSYLLRAAYLVHVTSMPWTPSRTNGILEAGWHTKIRVLKCAFPYSRQQHKAFSIFPLAIHTGISFKLFGIHLLCHCVFPWWLQLPLA